MKKMKKSTYGMRLLLCILILCALLLTACFDAGKQTEDSGGKSAADQVMEQNGQSGQNEQNPWAGGTDDPAKDTDAFQENPLPDDPAPAAETDVLPTETEQPAETEIIEAPETEAPVTQEPIEGESVGFEAEEAEQGEEYVIQTEPEETVIILPASGTVSSEQSKNLKLNADYTVTDNGDGTWNVHVLLRLTCYEIYAGERLESGKLYLCGEVHTFSTHELSNTERSLHSFNFYEAEATVPADSEINIAANWSFNGTYGSTYVGDLSLAATLYTE